MRLLLPRDWPIAPPTFAPPSTNDTTHLLASKNNALITILCMISIPPSIILFGDRTSTIGRCGWDGQGRYPRTCLTTVATASLGGGIASSFGRRRRRTRCPPADAAAHFRHRAAMAIFIPTGGVRGRCARCAIRILLPRRRRRRRHRTTPARASSTGTIAAAASAICIHVLPRAGLLVPTVRS